MELRHGPSRGPARLPGTAPLWLDMEADETPGAFERANLISRGGGTSMCGSHADSWLVWLYVSLPGARTPGRGGGGAGSFEAIRPIHS